mmetsp:Transcript_23501/g.35330  ORF Transcript_23501/g.35330 Transcript_23501/m.35330 type:complete len:89 (-) Transcript_23501:574-840(-)
MVVSTLLSLIFDYYYTTYRGIYSAAAADEEEEEEHKNHQQQQQHFFLSSSIVIIIDVSHQCRCFECIHLYWGSSATAAHRKGLMTKAF